MTDLRTAAQRLLDAIDRALPEAPLCSAFDVVADTADDLRKALAYREDKAQAAFERWLVEKLLTVTQAQMAHAEATCKQSLQVEPCNKSCAPGYCYCEQQGLTFTSFIGGEHQEPRYPVTQPIIKPEIKGDKTWKSLSDQDISDAYIKWDATPGVSMADFARDIEKKLRAKNSTLACIQGGEERK